MKEVFNRHSAIYTYDLSKLNNVNKVKFVYLLKGRKEGKGLIDQFGGYFLTNSCFVVPISKSDEIEKILKSWKVAYKIEEALLK